MLIKILLTFTALYSGGMWLFLAYRSFTGTIGNNTGKFGSRASADDVERYTFHLGLCFILSLGFLGLIGG
jgi:hypothetical protein